MRQLFKNSETAVDTIIASSKKHALASERGDYKTANKNYDLVTRAVDYLKKTNQLDKLKGLLSHEEVSIRIAAATFLLSYSEHDAISVLKEIASKSIPHQSFNAKMILQEWQNGNLKI